MPASEQPVQSASLTVPSFDLTRQNAVLESELVGAFTRTVRGGHFILGENVASLEQDIAKRCGVSFGMGVGNGSDALHLALMACGIGPGDEVVTTPFTFFATAGSIARTGARAVFCDIDPGTYNLDPDKAAAALTDRTKAILPVHLYGQPADMAPLRELATKHHLWLIEDAAQALGARYQDQPVGSWGDATCISFFPTKNLGAFGDAGMVVTDKPEIADRVRMLRAHGARKKYHSEFLGYNSRLDELQAAVLRVKEEHLEVWTARRREIAEIYMAGLAELSQVKSGLIRLPVVHPAAQHVYHQFTVGSPARDRLQAHLAANGIASMVYYPCPLHLQKVFEAWGYRQGDFPEAERASHEVLSLPMFPELTEAEIERVVEVIGQFEP